MKGYLGEPLRASAPLARYALASGYPLHHRSAFRYAHALRWFRYYPSRTSAASRAIRIMTLYDVLAYISANTNTYSYE
jgi:hypothetical protein